MSIEIIAEIAQGYEGNSKLAELLTIGSIRSGADSVKFQLVYADELAVPTYDYYDLFKSLELKEDDWKKIISLIHKNNKKIYFDIYGDFSFNQAKKLEVDGVKISTADFYNEDLVEKSIKSFKKVFISIAGVEIEELNIFTAKYKNYKNFVFMYGLQSEPTPIDQSNLRKLASYKKTFKDTPIGFMDHSSGDSKDAFNLPLMAMTLGIDYIEKHITLDRLLEVEDYISALTIDGFSIFVDDIRRLYSALGDGKLVVTDSEKKYKSVSGKVVVSTKDIKKGSILSLEDLSLKRVDTNEISPFFRKISDAKGKVLIRSIKKNNGIGLGDVCKED